MTLFTAATAQEAVAETFSYNNERFADLQMLRYQVSGFENLTLKQKKLIYYLSEAALCGRDILWDQNGRYNLRIRQLLESIYISYSGDRSTTEWQAFVTYLKRVWFSNGIHHHYGCDKFQPGFSEQFLREAIRQSDMSRFPLAKGQTMEAFCAELFPVIFDPAVMPSV